MNKTYIHIFENARSYKQPYHLISGILIVHDVMWKRLYFLLILFHFYLVYVCLYVCVCELEFSIFRRHVFFSALLFCADLSSFAPNDNPTALESTKIAQNHPRLCNIFLFLVFAVSLPLYLSLSPHFFCLFV